MDWLNAFAGLIVGIIVGLTGVGGGSLMSPILILLFGVSPATAIGTDLWFAAITKSVGGYVHHRHASVDFPIVGLLAVGSIPAALLTGLWMWQGQVGEMDSALLARGLGIVLLLTAVATLARRRLAAIARASRLRSYRYFAPVRGGATVLAGALLGMLVTLTSVGAGALGATMLLILYPRRLTVQRLVGTDITHAVPIALVGGIIHLLIGTVDFGLLAMLLIGSIPGIILGARLTAVVSERVVRPALALVLVAAGTKLLL